MRTTEHIVTLILAMVFGPFIFAGVVIALLSLVIATLIFAVFEEVFGKDQSP